MNTSVASVPGAPSSGVICTNSVMWAASAHAASSSRPSMSGGSSTTGGRTVGRPVRTPAPAATPNRVSSSSIAMPAVTSPGFTGSGSGGEAAGSLRGPSAFPRRRPPSSSPGFAGWGSTGSDSGAGFAGGLPGPSAPPRRRSAPSSPSTDWPCARGAAPRASTQMPSSAATRRGETVWESNVPCYPDCPPPVNATGCPI